MSEFKRFEWTKRLIDYKLKLSDRTILVMAILFLIAIGTLDYYLTIDISLSIFYLIPIILTTWYLEKTYGLVLVLLSTVIWFIGDSHSKQYSYGWLPYWNAGVRLGFFWSINYLLSSLKLAYEKEKYFARNDELTGAVNRRFFLELLALELQRCERYDRAFTLAYIDVDNFKLVNDRFGHHTGDRLLKLTIDTIKITIRNTDFVARLGGDEFAILLVETTEQTAQHTLIRVKQELDRAITVESFPVSFSIGAVTFIAIPNSVDGAIERADRLMYEIKHSGKNGLQHELYDYIV